MYCTVIYKKSKKRQLFDKIRFMKKNITININKLEIDAIIGVHSYERTKKQKLFINLEILINRETGLEDKIRTTLDYDELCQKIIETTEKSQYQLIETLAEHLLGDICKSKMIQKVTIEVIKPQAISKAESVSVIQSRENNVEN